MTLPANTPSRAQWLRLDQIRKGLIRSRIPLGGSTPKHLGRLTCRGGIVKPSYVTLKTLEAKGWIQWEEDPYQRTTQYSYWKAFVTPAGVEVLRCAQSVP